MALTSLAEELSSGLKSMKRKKKEQKEASLPVDVSADKYPWGLRLDLNSESMKALGLSAKDFTAGGVVTLEAKCDVIMVRSQDRMGGKGPDDSIELQITDLALGKKGE